MSKPKQPPQVCVSMPTYDLMQVSTCLSLINLSGQPRRGKFTGLVTSVRRSAPPALRLGLITFAFTICGTHGQAG